MSEKNHLFVTGLGRSGTTALTHVLASHEDIVLGMERFQRLYNPAKVDRVTPASFEREAFFDFADGLSSTKPEDPRFAALYAHADERIEAARYVGDKTTEMHVVPSLVKNFPKAKFLAIIRDVTPLAWSWEQRARNPEDRGWSAARGAEASVEFWNNSLKVIDEMVHAHPDRFYVVEYDAFFGSDGPFRAFLSQLGLPSTPASEAGYAKARRHFQANVEKKDRSLPAEVLEKIAAARNDELWNRLVDLSLRG
ncbi:sulfotransferase [Brachybacterium sp. DNPG3]